MTASWALSAGCLAAVAVLLVCEAKRSRWRGPAKITASLAFIAVPLVGGVELGETYGALVVAGLILGAFGDAALLGDSRRALLVGLLFFLAGHVAYTIAFAGRAELGAVAIAIGALFLVVGVGVIAPRTGSMIAPVSAYSIVIAVMVATALSQPAGWQAPVGAVLFAVSDLAVARQRFIKESLANRLFGLPTYYTGQLLIAWSAI